MTFRALLMSAFAIVFVATFALSSHTAPNTLAAQRTATRTPRVTATPETTVGKGSVFPDKFTFRDNPSPKDIVEFFLSERLISSGGRTLFELERDTFTRVESSGFTSLGIGFEKKAKFFVLHTKFGWRDAGKGSGCGVSVWLDREQRTISTFTSIMITNDFRVLARQVIGGQLQMEFDEEVSDDLYVPEKYNFLTVVSANNILAAYVNGVKVFEEEAEVQALDGQFAVTVFNEKLNTNKTFCTYQYGWVWSLPNRSSTTSG